jgi:magnesium-transporting ATPase (P-type)
LVASFGIVDKLKEGIHDVIEELYDSGVNTRIITGDHKETAIHTAREMGIIESHTEEGAISGDEFSQIVTPMMVLSQIGSERSY